MGRWVGEDAVFVVDYDDDDENEKRMSSTFFSFRDVDTVQVFFFGELAKLKYSFNMLYHIHGENII